MPKRLSVEAVEQYRNEGYHFPVPVLDASEVAHYRGRLEAYEAKSGAPLGGAERNKAHLVFQWVDELMRHDGILDLAEDLIGPDILCWNTLFWIKEAHSPSFVSWHQDIRYWGLDTSELLTVWVALSPASESSGCMRVLPGSHNKDVLPHRDEYHEDNLLTRGQSIAIDVDEAEAVSMALAPGEASLHNVQLAHASGPNTTDERRIGLAINYIPTSARQTVGEWDCAALVRGTDRYGHFEPTPQPLHDFDEAAVAFHKRATDNLREILFKDAERVRATL